MGSRRGDDPPKTWPLSIRVTGEERDWLRQEAYRRSSPEERVSVHGLLRQALSEYIDRNRKNRDRD